jgi:hypothetical protein
MELAYKVIPHIFVPALTLLGIKVVSYTHAGLNAGGGTSLMTLDGSGTLKVNGKLSVTGGVNSEGEVIP